MSAGGGSVNSTIPTFGSEGTAWGCVGARMPRARVSQARIVARKSFGMSRQATPTMTSALKPTLPATTVPCPASTRAGRKRRRTPIATRELGLTVVDSESGKRFVTAAEIASSPSRGMRLGLAR